MKVGLEYPLMSPWPSPEDFRPVAMMGMQGLQLRCRSLVELEGLRHGPYLGQLRDAAQDESVPVYSLAADALRLGYVPRPTRDDLNGWLRRLAIAMMACQTLGADSLVMPVRGRLDENENQAIVESLWPFIEEASDLACRYGIRVVIDWITGEQFLSGLPQSWTHGDLVGLRLAPVRMADIGIDPCQLLHDVGPGRLAEISLANIPDGQAETASSQQYMRNCEDFLRAASRSGFNGWITVEAKDSLLPAGPALFDVRRRIAALCSRINAEAQPQPGAGAARTRGMR